VSDWRPIETAPKDGTWILVWEQSPYEPSHYVARWGHPECGYEVDDRAWVTMELGPSPDNYNIMNATHWMTLPAPPVATEA